MLTEVPQLCLTGDHKITSTTVGQTQWFEPRPCTRAAVKRLLWSRGSHASWEFPGTPPPYLRASWLQVPFRDSINCFLPKGQTLGTSLLYFSSSSQSWHLNNGNKPEVGVYTAFGRGPGEIQHNAAAILDSFLCRGNLHTCFQTSDYQLWTHISGAAKQWPWRAWVQDSEGLAMPRSYRA